MESLTSVRLRWHLMIWGMPEVHLTFTIMSCYKVGFLNQNVILTLQVFFCYPFSWHLSVLISFFL